METQTRTLGTPDVDLVYEVRPPTTADAGRPTLLLAGHPMDARGFDTLASYFPERTVVAYDPRGIGRSVRKDGSDQRTPEMHAADLHALIGALDTGAGPVDVFASSGAPSTAWPSWPRTRRTSAPWSRTSRPCWRTFPTPRARSRPSARCRRRTRNAGSAPGWRPSSR